VSDLKEDLKDEVLAARELAAKQDQARVLREAERSDADKEKERVDKERRRIAAQNMRI
jgi:hypothetical protein